VNGLAGSETGSPVIPSGTVNLWAREAGLLKKPSEAVRLAVDGVRDVLTLGEGLAVLPLMEASESTRRWHIVCRGAKGG